MTEEPDQPLRPQVVALGQVRVEGTGMDYHGTGVPVASLRQLARRDVLEAAQGGDPDRIPGEGVLVGLVDGPMVDHPWLDGGYLASPNEFDSFVPDGTRWPPAERNRLVGHCTFVCGLILQQAPGAGVWTEKVLADGSAMADHVRKAALTLVERGVKILNLSLGCWSDRADTRNVLQTMVTELLARNPELVIVAAAGNVEPGQDRDGVEFLPAQLDNVVSVGSVRGDAGDDLITWADWSNKGPALDFAANGTAVLSTFLDGCVPRSTGAMDFRGWAEWSGTSFACAIVSGAIASTMTRHGMTAKQAVDHLKANPIARTSQHQVPVVPRELKWIDMALERSERLHPHWPDRFRRPN